MIDLTKTKHRFPNSQARDEFLQSLVDTGFTQDVQGAYGVERSGECFLYIFGNKGVKASDSHREYVNSTYQEVQIPKLTVDGENLLSDNEFQKLEDTDPKTLSFGERYGSTQIDISATIEASAKLVKKLDTVNHGYELSEGVVERLSQTTYKFVNVTDRDNFLKMLSDIGYVKSSVTLPEVMPFYLLLHSVNDLTYCWSEMYYNNSTLEDCTVDNYDELISDIYNKCRIRPIAKFKLPLQEEKIKKSHVYLKIVNGDIFNTSEYLTKKEAKNKGYTEKNNWYKISQTRKYRS